MKTKLLSLLLCLTLSLSFSQTTKPLTTNKDSIYVIKEVDAMSNKIYYYTNRSLIVKDETGKIGFRIDIILSDAMQFSTLAATMVGIGNCNENDEIIILLENGEKITKKSWKKFNCDGETYFDFDNDEIDKLKTSPITKIRMTNGRTYDSYTGNVTSKNKRYLIQLFYCLDNKLFVEAKK